ncbi:heavy metal translocating P-type ATPase [Halovenus sp. WSH3]|uniref:Heavy metal translocating P-type ATPase n=1 Tax=Halovenus carboxidivorans TaxID=2692199 RepID=A0A6B0TBC6_9EURY|nr:cation-translocating P-type ATPase [Halovenus carboxidivorans]MXR52672.1 heavy metal translocating P-type ATPase [Halovenus carboxidivorans]
MDDPARCRLCNEPIGPTATDEQSYCSPGCRQVDRTLGAGGSTDQSTGATGEDEQTGAEQVYLHIDGMHCATCEAFLERRATNREGVFDAAASYVTETIRIEYDPEQITVDELEDALTTVGYSVVPRESLVTVADVHERRWDDRQLDDMLGFRYAAGVLFGLFMMLPYITVVYPVHLMDLLGTGDLAFFSGGQGPGDALMVLPIFMIITGVVLFFTGLPLLRGAYVSLVMRQPNLDLLVAVTITSAYVYGTVAFLTSDLNIYFDLTILIAAVVVTTIYYESLTKQRAVDLLTELTVSQVTEANRYESDGTTETVDISELEANDRVLVREGERVPVDGVLESGSCTVDEAVVTGESLPVRKESGDELIGGSIVTSDGATIRVGDPPTSSLDALTTSVWDLQSTTHGIQRWSDRLAERVIPGVVAVAVCAAAAGVWLNGLLGGVLAGLGVLFIANPWGLGLSTPLSVARSIEAAISHGIIVFDETVFERLRETDTVVFDKTGTLTTGEMNILTTDVPDQALAKAAELEQHAAHPAGKAIASAVEFGAEARPDGGTGRGETVDPPEETTPTERVSNVRSHDTGIEGDVEGERLLVGNLALFAERDWAVSREIERKAVGYREAGDLPVVIGREGEAEGLVVLGDDPREEWEEILRRLADREIRTVVLTGDDASAASLFDDHPAVEHVFAGVPPAGKTATIHRLQQDGHVTMVGDGTNDGPALAAADLGISLGGGTALASEAADITVLDDDLSNVETAFELAAGARERLRQNTALALGFNAVTIPLGLAGWLNPLFVMGAGVLTICAVSLNATRPLIGP